MGNHPRANPRRREGADRHRPTDRTTADEPGIPHDRDPVWLALATLPERNRTVLVLRFYLDLPDDEIAALISARPGTVRSLVSRGLARLHEELAP